MKIGSENSKFQHSFGEYIGEKSNGNFKFAIEISARDGLHLSPLHGVVWYYIQNFEYKTDKIKLKDFVEELCYFNSPETTELWLSCKIKIQIKFPYNY